jgi:hypothetical protein
MNVLPVLLLLDLNALAAKKPVQEEPVEAPRTTEVTGSDGLIEQTVDLDRDGRPDVFNTFRVRADGVRQLVAKRTDLDRDGRVDLFSDFDEAGALVEERMDGDFDGKVDWVDHYKGGVRVMAEHDSDFDGRTDTWLYYLPREGGGAAIDRKERDTNGDGKVDVWERFDNAGNVVRTGRDVDGDGVMDERDQ